MTTTGSLSPRIVVGVDGSVPAGVLRTTSQGHATRVLCDTDDGAAVTS